MLYICARTYLYIIIEFKNYIPMMSMKEACAYLKQSRKDRAKKHRETVTQGDYCEKFTDKQYKLVKVKQKSTFTKGKTAAFTSHWRHNNIPLPK